MNCENKINRSNHSFRYTEKSCGDVYRGKLLLCDKCKTKQTEKEDDCLDKQKVKNAIKKTFSDLGMKIEHAEF